MRQFFGQVFDFEGVKVACATAMPFIVWGSQLELAIKLLTGLGAAIYVWRKALAKPKA